MHRRGLEAAGWPVETQRTGIDGIEGLRRLRGEPATADCPVVVLTNSASLKEALEEASRPGVMGWMVKSRTAPRELAARLDLVGVA